MAIITKRFFLSLLILLFSFSPTPLFALTITQTQSVNVSAVVGGLPFLDSGGDKQSGVRFSGLAYPKAVVSVIKRDGSILTIPADEKGVFTLFVPENNWQLFTLFATDTFGRKSTLLNFPTVLYNGIITDITGIRFAPTITTDKLSVKKGDFITIEGSALPNTQVEVVIEGFGGQTFTLPTNEKGLYRITLPAAFPEGEYLLRVRYIGDSRTSKAIKFTVGATSILRTEASSNIPGDCNFDQRVTLVDFSVLAYWYGKQNPPRCVDANQDGIINLVDFSIVAFYWNG